MKKLQIAVIGSAGQDEYPYRKPRKSMNEAAEKMGELLARNECIVVSGGKGGVMEAVCRGAKKAGGVTIAEIASNGRGESNQYVDVEVVTNDIGYRGPSLLVGMSDAVVALGGGAGTLQELAVAYRMKKPIVLLNGYGGWADRLSQTYLDERRLVPFVRTRSVKEAVDIVIKLGGVERN